VAICSWPQTLGQLKATGVDFGVFLFRLLLDGQQGLRRESVRFQTTPEREKAALRFAEFVLGEEFQSEWAMAQAICR